MRATTQKIEVERKKIIASAKLASVDTGFADLWLREMGALAEAFRNGAERAQPAPSVQQVAPVDAPFDANIIKRLIDETVRSLDEWEIARNCAHYCLRPIQGLMTAARASAEIGDTVRADLLIAKAEALVVRPHYQHTTQVQELVAIAKVRMAMRAPSTRAAVDRAAAVALAAESSTALTALAGHYRVLGVNDKRIELLSKVQALVVANGWFVDGLAEELERGGNRQAAVALMADALGSTQVASRAGIIANSAERIWPPLAPMTAATFARLSAIQRANASRVPRAPVAGVEPLETDWVSTLSSAVARWRATGDITALSKAKAELTATASSFDREPARDRHHRPGNGDDPRCARRCRGVSRCGRRQVRRRTGSSQADTGTSGRQSRASEPAQTGGEHSLTRSAASSCSVRSLCRRQRSAISGR